MAILPKIEVKEYHGDGKYDYAVFRADRIKPMCSGISKAHAEHLKKILSRRETLPDEFPAAKNWFEFDEIVEVDEKGYGKLRGGS
jgi:hypothetical protein